jgi:hypothetical protein
VAAVVGVQLAQVLLVLVVVLLEQQVLTRPTEPLIQAVAVVEEIQAVLVVQV